MVLVRHPVTVESPDEFLAEARRLIDTETDHLDRRGGISCGPRCNACCNHAVSVTPAEIRAILAAVALLPPAVRAQITARAQHIIARVDREITPALGRSDVDDGPRRYFELGEPCPLLVGGACAVRPERPLVCRDYIVSSDPAHCADPDGGQMVRVRRRAPIDVGFALVSEAFDEPGGRLLARALLESPPPPPEGRAQRGAALARLLTEPRSPSPSAT